MISAVAHPNIALIKYWGKRDAELHLPTNSSLSVTLDVFPTTTSVDVVDGLAADLVTIAGAPADAGFASRVRRFLDLVRGLAGSRRHCVVDTVNTVPTGAGLASSASGFAALACAAAGAYGLDLDDRALSRLARRGSGSAARSIYGGFVQWHRGDGVGEQGDAGSYAEPVDGGGLDPAIVIVVLDAKQKVVSSGEAMRHTVATSPLYRAWTESTDQDFQLMRVAIAEGDFDAVGEIAEHNALGMHATMLAARPAIRYLSGRSLDVLDRVRSLRGNGIAAFATIDAGPNVKVLCRRSEAGAVARAFADLEVPVVTSGLGPGVSVTAGPVLGVGHS